MLKKPTRLIAAGVMRVRRRCSTMLDIVVFVGALVFILAACTMTKPGAAAASASPSASGSSVVSVSASPNVTPSAEPENTPLPYREYTLGIENSAKLHLGMQDGQFPWGYAFNGVITASDTSGDMPGTVINRVEGDALRLFYRHIEETGKDVVSTFMTTSDKYVTARGIKHGDSVEQLLKAYGSDLLNVPKPFPVSQDLGGDFCVYDELYVYTRPEDDNCCLVFYVVDNVDGKRITGIQASLGQDGGPAYSADNVNTFAVDYTNPDKYLKTDTSAEEKVHALFHTQGTVDKSALLEAMAGFNWRLYDELYHTDAIDLMDWLYQQKITGEHDILCVLKATKGLDGGYSEGFSDILANIYKADSRTFIRLASQLDDSKIDVIAQLLCFGIYEGQDDVVSELKDYQNSGKMTESELLVIEGILHSFEAGYSN